MILHLIHILMILLLNSTDSYSIQPWKQIITVFLVRLCKIYSCLHKSYRKNVRCKMIQTFMVVCKWYIQFKAHNVEKTVITYKKIKLLKAGTASSMMQNPPWRANTLSASQQMLCLLSVPSRTNNSPLSEPNPNHINPLSHPEDGGIFLHNTGTSLKKKTTSHHTLQELFPCL